VDIENQIATLRAMLKNVRFDDPGFRSFIRQQLRNVESRRQQRALDRETIRRLKIQNKKLLERVTSLKEQLKQVRKMSSKNGGHDR
jgi:hypothetical protein